MADAGVRTRLTTRFFARVLAVYLLATLLVTGIHAVHEYRTVQAQLRASLENIEPLLRESLTNAVWQLDEEQIGRVLDGVVRYPEVTGVRLLDEFGGELGRRGLVPESDADPELSLRIELSKPWQAGGRLGEIRLYSSTESATERVVGLLNWILAAAALKVLLLWLAITWFGRRMLAEPLARLTERIRALPVEVPEPEDAAHHLANDELALLAEVIERMDAKLRATLSDLQSANEQLRESNWRLQRAVEQSPAAVIIFDEQGVVRYANPAFARMTGYPLEQADTVMRDVLFADAPLQVPMRRWRDGELAEERLRLERHLLRPDGQDYWADVTLSPVRDDGGSISHFLCTLVDISKRKRAEAALKEKTAEQEETIRKLEATTTQLLQSEKMASIGQLAAGVAHEINNPIGYVNSNLGTLRSYVTELIGLLERYRDAESEADRVAAREALEKADFDFLREDLISLLDESAEGLERVKRIIQDLKDFSHADKGERQLTDLHKGLDSTLNVVWNELKYKCEVVKEYGELPQVVCSASQINQVFMNLLVNAAHAIEERGTIHIRTGHEDDRVWVEIEDDGCGIAPENLPRLFEPFFTTKPVGKGTGLGLSVSYGIVKKHGGEIEVDSVPGRGTRFRVWLPVNPPPQDQE